MTGGGSSLVEVQALLRVLAVGKDAAEIGTGFGAGAAAMAETARTVVTAERDPTRAAHARRVLARYANVEVLEGDAYEVLRDRGPFGLVFADGGPYDWEAIFDMLRPGGLLVKDDLTPGRAAEGDPVREFLLGDPRLSAVEILTTSHTAAIVAARHIC